MKVLGRGAFKTVYKAYDSHTSMEVAWNELPFPASGPVSKSMYSEIRALSSVQHENVMRMFFWWHDRSRDMIIFITELFVPGSIKAHLETYFPVSMNAISMWVLQIVKALQALHGAERPIIHRDIKCDNIFINSNTGTVKVGDLGTSLLKASSRQNSVAGTLRYMAPEVFEGICDTRADIYSLGVSILEMLTNKDPYSECDNMAQMYGKVFSGTPPLALIQMRPSELKHIVLGCLAPAEERITLEQILQSPFFLNPEGSAAVKSTTTEPRLRSFGYILDMGKKP